MNKFIMRLLLNICFLVILLGMFSAITCTVQAQASGETRSAEMHSITYTQLQQIFYKADIEKEISLDIHNLSLQQALREIAQQTGLRLTYRGDILVDKTVSLQENSIRVIDALDYIMEGTGLDYKFSKNGYLLITRVDEVKEEDVLQFIVRGSVFDELTGEALPGVNILVQGTTDMGTITNIDGEFELQVPDLQQTLVFSYIGYRNLIVDIGGRTELEIQLAPDVMLLDNIVVVGYGTQRRDDVTGSVSQISGRDIASQPSIQTSATLMGRVPGVQVSQNSGEPGANMGSVIIRGFGTLGNSNPLILIDGISGSLNDVASSDIESITVLKDASASAIYGSRAANGVILVTTKRGQIEAMQVNYRGFGGWQRPTNLPEFADGETFMRLENLGATNLGNMPIWSEDYINNWVNNHQTDPDNYPNTNWVDMLFTEPGFQQRHNLEITGGTETIRYMGSLTYDSENGNIPNFGFERYAIRLNTDVTASERLNFDFDLNLQRSDRTRPSAGLWDLTQDAFRIPPVYAAQYTHGGWGPGWNNNNPIARAIDGGLQEQQNYRIRGRFRAGYQPIENLQIDLTYSPEYVSRFFRGMTRQYNISSPNEPGSIVARHPGMSSLSQSTDNFFINNLHVTANYALNISDHSVSILGGFEYYDFRNDFFSSFRDDFTLQDFQQLNAGSAANMQNSGTASEHALASYFSRFNYSYQSKYLFEANFRYDGSSRFTAENRWGFFPSFSVGWMISQESFMDPIDVISSLKIRASWGELGNQRIGTYPFASVVNLGQNFIFGGSTVSGAAQNSLANTDITWETTTSTNLGLDLELFDNRVYLNFDYFEQETRDILLQLPIPSIIGLSAPFQNAGVVKNTGWELEAGYLGLIGNDLSYRVAFNLSDVRNEVVDLRGAGPFISGNRIIKEGYPINSFWGWESDGLFQSQEEVNNHASQFGNIAPGDIRYVDQNGDGVIDDSDRVVIGDPFPSLHFGIDLSFNYRNFDLSAFFQGVGNRDVLLQGDAVWPLYNAGKIRDWHVDAFWTPENPDASIPRLTQSGNHSNFTASDYWIYDASYVRLRNLQIGYTLPTRLANSLQLRGARVYFLGQNLFTLFDNMPPGIDPNVPDVTFGGFYPVTRLISTGIEINF